jgi:hypothetical protein
MAVSGRDAMLHRRVLLGGVTKGQSAFFLIIEGRHVACQSCLHRDKPGMVGGVAKGQRAFFLIVGGRSSYPNFRSGGVNPPGAM